jgi:hypothetical protein
VREVETTREFHFQSKKNHFFSFFSQVECCRVMEIFLF